MNPKEISCVILSGGKSSRMGQDKALLEFNGITLVDYIAKNLSFASEILLSVKDEKDFPEIDLVHIADDYPGCGPLAGIHSALKHASNPWIFIVACDTPFVSEALVRKLLDQVTHDSLAVIPREKNGRLHVLCALYHQNMLPVIEKQLTEKNFRIRQAIEGEHTIYVPVEEFLDCDKTFYNMNTFEEYKELPV